MWLSLVILYFPEIQIVFNINTTNSNESSVSKDVLFEEIIKVSKPLNILDHSSEKPEISQTHLVEENWK